MTVYNLGSINIDHVYRVPHIPAPGETLAASAHATGLGGKGANQSVAVARAGARAVHVGAVGVEGGPWVEHLQGFGVETRVAEVEEATGHANICVDKAGENMIVIFPGANLKQSLTHLETALADAQEGDFLLLQNETNLGREAAGLARAKGMRVVYSAAPFSVEAVQEMLPDTDLLVMNEVEAAQLQSALGNFALPDRLITRGAKGVIWLGPEEISLPAFAVTPVDTTGAGDCFIGTFVAGLDQGLDLPKALRLGQAASAIQVTRPGTADAIPTRAETDAFLDRQEAK
ncbi:ribokinase [Aliiroseovarius sp.]|uniref:ribokinase n=1 Tax=Aliiroseovarius sp. TaxID=1872442 RepID=UPI0026171518|nr:ribokinase [Aliiroseovarius sp.]